ncbi:MAG: hypothetical protein K0U16_07780 [Gammaproteobacteria bacterium]|nr:hypothetical protein [Gammaproteobacteria bacterium]
MSSSHVIITGTGRAGTTFLVQLLTAIGADTGFGFDVGAERRLSVPVHNTGRAGAELALFPGAPIIVKSPHLCFQLEGILAAHPDLVVSHAIVPMRTLRDAASSRRRIQEIAGEEAPNGGLWNTSDPDEQEFVLAVALHQLMRTLAVHSIPVLLLDFPRIVHDKDYLHERLSTVFMLPKDRFDAAFAETVRPELVHTFE